MKEYKFDLESMGLVLKTYKIQKYNKNKVFESKQKFFQNYFNIKWHNLHTKHTQKRYISLHIFL